MENAGKKTIVNEKLFMTWIPVKDWTEVPINIPLLVINDLCEDILHVELDVEGGTTFISYDFGQSWSDRMDEWEITHYCIPTKNKNVFTNLRKETKVRAAIDLVMLDAIEMGLTTVADAVAYMKSEAFKKSVKGYLDLMDKQ